MRLIELSPEELARHPEFTKTLALMRDEVEVPMFAGDASYDVDLYQQAWARGAIRCAAVMGTAGELLAWGLMTVAVIPRRERPVHSTDAMWSANADAGGAVMRHFMRLAHPEPLFVTASAGGRLAAALTASRLATHTHNVYTLQHPGRRSVRS